jgi:dipeptidyl aminopeptidase/acylaminoacyl peptidase
MKSKIYNIIETFKSPDTTLYSHLPTKKQELWLKKWDSLIFEKITYISDKFDVKGFIVTPKKGKNLPVIIYNRGGSKDFGKIEDRQLFFLLAKIASWGYVVIASQYRGNDGGEGKDECGGKDINDVINLKQVIDVLPNVDTNRIGMFGGSRGGMQSLLALEKMDFIKAVVCRAGSSNEIRGYKLRPEVQEFRSDMYDVYSDSENFKRSTVCRTHLLPKNVPILLLHGSSDEQVIVLDSIDLATKLYENKIPCKLVVYPGDNHRISINQNESMDEAKNWFTKYVKNLEEPPTL